ncbi:MAG: carbonic anhydrase family protein [Proteobacteria bacterium]|nr:carbonic anhydrase family protein [Pseudomonadota bacterium]
MKTARLLAALLLLPAALPVGAADWQMVVRDRNRQVEIDRASVFNSDRGTKVSWARVVLTAEEAATAGYATIKALNRYDCMNRSFMTVKRVYLDASEQIIREEAVSDQAPMLVARNSVDERLWQEVCRPPTAKDLEKIADEAVKATAGALDARKGPPAAKPPVVATRPAPAPTPVVQAKPEPIPRADPVARPVPIAARDVAASQVRSGDIRPAEADKTRAAPQTAAQGSIVPPLPRLELPPPPEGAADTRARVAAEVRQPAPAEMKPEPKVKPEPSVRPEPKVREAAPARPAALAKGPASGSGALAAAVEARPARDRKALDEAALAALVQRSAAPAPRPAPIRPQPDGGVASAAAWSYDGETGPQYWGRLRPEWSVCALGTRQAPIELRDGVGVDLEPVKFDYRPSHFRVTDTGTTLRVELDEAMGMEVRGRRYLLEYLSLHRAAQQGSAGEAQDMVAQFWHRDAEGNRAMLAVPLAVGAQASPALQMLWNNLPLDRGRSFAPAATLDASTLLPTDPAHYLYIGSLPEPPCTEGVLWVVMKRPVSLSAEQLAVFTRLYPHNSRPAQPANGRLVLESR